MLFIGGDHAGYKLKEQIKKYLLHQGIDYEDLGPLNFVPTDDYPDYGFAVAKKVSANSKNRGVLICGSSAGVCIVANKAKGIRAAQVMSPEDAKFARQHNDANIICLSGWRLSREQAVKIIKKFLETPFSEENRHARRVSKIKKIEEKTMK